MFHCPITCIGYLIYHIKSVYHTILFVREVGNIWRMCMMASFTNPIVIFLFKIERKKLFEKWLFTCIHCTWKDQFSPNEPPHIFFTPFSLASCSHSLVSVVKKNWEDRKKYEKRRKLSSRGNRLRTLRKQKIRKNLQRKKKEQGLMCNFKGDDIYQMVYLSLWLITLGLEYYRLWP